MAWRSSGATLAELVDNLVGHGMIPNERVKQAFLAVDRAHYAPRRPYQDAPQSIGHGVTISAPHMHAMAVKHLGAYVLGGDARGQGKRVLDVGSGSGYLTHILAELAGEDGAVVGVEHIPALCEQAKQNMGKSGEGRHLLATGRVKFVVGDGRLGVPPSSGGPQESEDPAGGTFDAIHVGASAATLPPALVAQLRAPGRMFIPIDDEGDTEGNQSVWTIDKAADGTVTKTRLFGVRYVPLTDAPR
ncbi:hypothetical protein SCUCBS95973_007961 [Sporothrix curviconia]|uniref:protein-L-isoaspartate(D-aspartate) O-methyltransferase n=1 Tax=Sporothrix curviconia TaxID=1260050 RepID=A0ABP0CIZ4_9PEZI